jgi:hypothetical protein
MQPYQQRVIDEKAELDDKLIRLTQFIIGDVFKDVAVDEQARLTRQCGIMKEYSDVLGERIANF